MFALTTQFRAEAKSVKGFWLLLLRPDAVYGVACCPSYVSHVLQATVFHVHVTFFIHVHMYRKYTSRLLGKCQSRFVAFVLIWHPSV